MARLFKELSIIEFDQESKKNIFMVNVRDIKGKQEQKQFSNFDDAMSYYKGLDKKIETTFKEDADPNKAIVGNTNHDEIRLYVLKNEADKSKRSARHLNAKFKLKLKQYEYNEILGL